jgi:hypothetical protein
VSPGCIATTAFVPPKAASSFESNSVEQREVDASFFGMTSLDFLMKLKFDSLLLFNLRLVMLTMEASILHQPISKIAFMIDLHILFNA